MTMLHKATLLKWLLSNSKCMAEVWGPQCWGYLCISHTSLRVRSYYLADLLLLFLIHELFHRLNFSVILSHSSKDCIFIAAFDYYSVYLVSVTVHLAISLIPNVATQADSNVATAGFSYASILKTRLVFGVKWHEKNVSYTFCKIPAIWAVILWLYGNMLLSTTL